MVLKRKNQHVTKLNIYKTQDVEKLNMLQKNKQCNMIKTLQITNAHMLQKTYARYQPACVTEARHGTVQ